MKLEADPWQRFLVYSMLFGQTVDEREPKQGDSLLNKKTALRNELVKWGIIRVEQRSRHVGKRRVKAGHLVLEERAWDFAIENLGKALPKTPLSASLLEKVLARLGASIASGSYSLAEFVRGDAAVDGVTEVDAAPPTEEEVRAACLSLGGGTTGKRIRLAALRDKVPARRESLDSLLQAMQQAGQLVLFKLDNPAEITPEDEQAALVISGYPRHLVYLEA